jgi:DNA polymerase I-like protein with 3'-5' exonuclease and polymerase domains
MVGMPLRRRSPRSLDEQLDRLEAGEEYEEEELRWIGGLGLANAVQRILNLPDHKEEAHQWLRLNVAEARGKLGKYLGRLPRALLERYNVGDTEATLRLYAFLVGHFARLGYDWRLDHTLYFSTVRSVVAAKIRGVRVDREALATYAKQVGREIEEISGSFSARFAVEICAVERGRLLKQIRKRKTLRGRKQFVRRYRMGSGSAVEDVRFNVGSNNQLAALFVSTLGMEPKFKTDKGAPSFRSAVLSQWGSGGEVLKTRRKRMLVLKQAEALLELSAVDGRWHVEIKVAATSTGRLAGGSHGT